MTSPIQRFEMSPRSLVALLAAAVMSLGLSALALAAPASAQTTFVQLGLPYGIVTDANGNVFVTHDGTSTTFLTKFSPSGEEIDTISIGGITVGQVGRLAMDPATGEIWNLSIEGDLRIVDPDTLAVQPLSNLRGVDLSATSTHVWNAALEGFFSQVDYFQPSVSTFGDIALYRSQNNARLDAFITARHTANFPYVFRLTWVNDQYVGATALMYSYPIPVNVPRGIAVGPSGRVVTTLPLPGRLGVELTDQVISFPANFPEQGVPRVELDKWDESSRGIGTDAAGNFYLTSQINSSLCGVNAGAAIMVLSPQLEFRACHPRSLLAAGEDVAVTASGDHVYSTIQSQLYLGAENAVVDWGRLAPAGGSPGPPGGGPAAGGAPGSSGTVPGGGTATAGAAVIAIKGKGQGNTVRIPASRLLALQGASVACPASGGRRCSGKAVIRTAGAVNAEAHADRRRKLTLGNTRFSVSPGSSWKVRVKLSRTAMRVLRKLKSIKAVVTVSAGNGAQTATKKFGVKLKAPARR